MSDVENQEQFDSEFTPVEDTGTFMGTPGEKTPFQFKVMLCLLMSALILTVVVILFIRQGENNSEQEKVPTKEVKLEGSSLL